MSDSEQRKIDRYGEREKTALGRAFNDVMDGARELANRVQYVLPGRSQSEREMFHRAIREDREEKQWTREHYKQTGRMETRDEIAADAHYSAQHARTSYKARQEREIQNALGGGEREAAQARERLDYQLRHPGPGEMAERHADLAGDATVDRSQIDKIIRQEAAQARNPVFDRWTTGADYEKALEAQQAQQKFVRERAQAAERGWKPNEHPEDPHYHERFGNRELSLSWEVVGNRQILPFVDSKENGTMAATKTDGLSLLDSKSRELVSAAANAIQKVDWAYDRSPDPTVRSEGLKHMRAAVHSLDAVVTHGDNLLVEYAMDAVDAVKQHTLRTEAASAIWQHHAPKMASETKEYHRPDWFYSEKLHANSWDMEKISAMGREHQSVRVGASQPGVNSMDSEVKAAKQHVREREQERWNRVEQIGRQAIDSDKARVTEKQTSTTDADLATKAERQRPQTA